MNTKIPTVNTERLILREFKEADSPCMHKNWFSDIECSKYTNMKPMSDDEGCWKFINFMETLYDEGLFLWAICLKENNEPIGMICFELSDDTEISFIVGSEFKNCGYATESLSAILQFCTEKLDLKYVWGYHFAENISAGKVMKKAGMKYARSEISRNNFFDKDMTIDVYEYGEICEV